MHGEEIRRGVIIFAVEGSNRGQRSIGRCEVERHMYLWR
jgi:hypothetical protein